MLRPWQCPSATLLPLYLNATLVPALPKSIFPEPSRRQHQHRHRRQPTKPEQPAPSFAYPSFIPTRRYSVIHSATATSSVASASAKRPRAIPSIPAIPALNRAFFSSQSRHITDMSEKLIPSKPQDVMVIRNVTPNIATFSVPFSRYGKIKIGGRGTLVKLSSGSLAVFSPVALTEAAKAKVAEMGGNVRYIVALDYEHHIFVSKWANEYPSAKLIGPEGLPEKRAKQQDDPKIGSEEFAVVFKKDGKREIRIDAEFDADFDYEYVDGHANLEIIFLYKPERVMIQADLLFNLPPTEQYSKVPSADVPQDGAIGKVFAGVQNPRGDVKWLKRFNWYIAAKDRNSFNDSMDRIAAWDFATIIPCHGDVMEGDGKDIFLKAFEWHINGHK